MQAFVGASVEASDEGIEQRAWPTLLSPQGLQFSRDVLTRAHAPQLAELIETVARGETTAGTPTTRQALHARLQRMQSTIAGGAILLASNSSDFTDFVLSRDFALLRPMSAATHMKVRYLSQALPEVNRDGCRRMFDRCFAALTRLCRRLDQIDDGEVLCVHGALAGMFMGPFLFGSEFLEQWTHAHERARTLGLLEHPYVRMQLTLMGSFVGHWQEHCEWLQKPENRDLDIGDMYLFVRRDCLPVLTQLQVSHIRGHVVPSQSCLYSRRPWSTLSLLLDYVAGRLREPGQMESPGLMLMALGWLQLVHQHMATLSDDPACDGNRRSLDSRLSKIERIQVMEKRRFWQMLEGPLPQDLKAQIAALWGGACRKR
jgi:hypothetical protein